MAPLIAEPVINLVPADDAAELLDQTVVCLNGDTQQGKSFWFDGIVWTASQQKTKLNQAPLFDIVDVNGYSFSDTTVYPGSTFTGTEFFAYAEGTGKYDTILTNLKLKYQNFNNIGDIVFQSDYDLDSFNYISNLKSATLPVSSGYLAKNDTLLDRTFLNNWVAVTEPSKQYQIISVIYSGVSEYIKLDILPDNATSIPFTSFNSSSSFMLGSFECVNF